MAMAMPVRTPQQRLADAQERLTLNHLCQYLAGRLTPPDWEHIDRLRASDPAIRREIAEALDAVAQEKIALARRPWVAQGPVRCITQDELDALDF